MDRNSNNEMRPAKSDGGDSAGAVYPYSVVSIQDDYIVCNAVKRDGTVITSKTFNVVKPYRLRRTPFDGKTIAGKAYTYSSNVQRTVVGSATEIQQITEDYNIGDIIYAAPLGVPVSLSDGSKGIYLDINADGRAWAKQ